MSRTTALGLAAALLAFELILGGCGGSHIEVTNRLVTPEQDRQDLQRALAAGAISQAEYEQMLQRLVSP